MSWNIHGAVGSDRRRDPDRIVAVLAELDADVVGLQEVDWRHPPHRGHDQLALLAHELDMEPIAGPNLRDHAGEFGNGLLVRGSVLADRRIDLAEPRREPRGVIDADLRVGDHRVRAMVTHLGLGRRERRRQLRRIQTALATPPEANAPPDVTAILADLNEWMPVSRRRDALRRMHLPLMVGGRSFPSRLPILGLDRILLAPADLTVTGGVERSAAARRASDHLPVVADVHLPQTHAGSRSGVRPASSPLRSVR